jgi:hypothetical protein
MMGLLMDFLSIYLFLGKDKESAEVTHEAGEFGLCPRPAWILLV